MLACYYSQGKQLASGVIGLLNCQSHYNVSGINTTPCARLLLRHPLDQRIPTRTCESTVSANNHDGTDNHQGGARTRAGSEVSENERRGEYTSKKEEMKNNSRASPASCHWIGGDQSHHITSHSLGFWCSTEPNNVKHSGLQFILLKASVPEHH